MNPSYGGSAAATGEYANAYEGEEGEIGFVDKKTGFPLHPKEPVFVSIRCTSYNKTLIHVLQVNLMRLKDSY